MAQASGESYDPELRMYRQKPVVDRSRLMFLRRLALAGELEMDGADIAQVVASKRANGLEVRLCDARIEAERCGICARCYPDRPTAEVR